jgi:tripartite-type tricarboxylate transporter receptor subunit TctC
MKRRQFLAATGGTTAAVLGTQLIANSALAQTPAASSGLLPKGPVKIVVGFPPGGGTDALARVVGAKLQAMWGVSIVEVQT